MTNPSFWRKHRMARLAILFGGGLVASLSLTALFADIQEKKTEARQYPMMLSKLSDEDVSPKTWGQNFPSQYSSYMQMENAAEPTDFGGSLAYSKNIRYPQINRLWGGFPFGLDFNEERSHMYTQLDQVETKRNDKAWLNAHGLPKFMGQPGACMNCHSGWAPSLIAELGWEGFNKTPYVELRDKLREKHGEGLHKAELGSACADCHSPKDMSLRVTRPAYINAMVARGYEKDELQGLKASRQEMRTHVCQQCHVEYYFKGENKELVFPWNNWPKDKPLKIEMIESYYDAQAASEKGFKQDWIHKETKAPMLKMQHPEAELFSSGLHAKSGVACADCHMPYVREGANKITTHNLRSPLLNVQSSCQSCHAIPEEKLKERVKSIQLSTANSLRKSEGAVLALIDDLKTAEQLLRDSDVVKNLASDAEKDAKVGEILGKARDFHRRASMRWDFIFSENSTGFHSPGESQRVLLQSIEMARLGQLEIQSQLQKVGMRFEPTVGAGKVPVAGTPIPEHHYPVGSVPPARLFEADKEAVDYGNN